MDKSQILAEIQNLEIEIFEKQQKLDDLKNKLSEV